MTDVLSRMLNDPRTRVGITQGNEITNESDLATAVANYRNLLAVPTTSETAAGFLNMTVPGTGTSDNTKDNLKQIPEREIMECFDYLRMKYVGHRNAR